MLYLVFVFIQFDIKTVYNKYLFLTAKVAVQQTIKSMC